MNNSSNSFDIDEQEMNDHLRNQCLKHFGDLTHFDTLMKAHDSRLDRSILKRSQSCCCFYCLKSFPISSVVIPSDPIEDVLCPICGVDSVLGDASGFDINDTHFMEMMKRFWFSPNSN